MVNIKSPLRRVGTTDAIVLALPKSYSPALLPLSAMNLRSLHKLFALAALAVGSSLYAADTGEAKAAADKAAADKATATKATAEATKKDEAKFNAQRDKMIASREALSKQLKNATEEQRKAIFDKMKDLVDQQRELDKQFRDEFRKVLRSQGTPGRN